MSVSPANALVPRFLHAEVRRDLRLYPVVALMGARQVGKSTLCLQVAEELGLALRTLDDKDVRDQAVHDPEGLLAGLGTAGAFIDEAQRAPELLLAMKAVVDRERLPGRYLISGSSQPIMRHAVADSLLGRAAYRTLRPLTLGELRFSEHHAGWTFLFERGTDAIVAELARRAEASGALDWRQIVATGGLPRAALAPPDFRRRLLNDYVEVFATRDIHEVLAVDRRRFEPFLRLVAARTGQEWNASGMSRDLGVPVATIRRWLDALQRSYLVESIPAYSRNAGERVIKAPKVFLADAALALAAAREAEPTGFHLETLVVSDMLAWKDRDPSRAVHHWRLGSGPEVDFVLQQADALVPVEVKATAAIGSSDARHLRMFRERIPATVRALLLSGDPDIRVIRDGIIAAPWWAVL